MNKKTECVKKISIKKIFNNICFWLFIIALILIIGVGLFCIYLYKLELIHIVDFRALFFDDNNKFSAIVFWTAIGAIGAVVVGVLTVRNNYQLFKLQKRQHDLYTTPRIMLKNISIKESLAFETDKTGKEIKTIKDVNFPYFTNTIKPFDNLSDLAIIVLNITNTSEAFAKVDVSKITIDIDLERIAEFNGSTFGVHNSSLFLEKNTCGKIGLIVDKSLIKLIRGLKLTTSFLLHNNFNETYKHTYTYYLTASVDDVVSFMPASSKDNEFIKIV